VPLPTYLGARFRIDTSHGPVEVPSAPVDIPAGTLARWPLGLPVEGVTVDWATASAVTVLPGSERTPPTLVLLEDAGICVEVAHDGVAYAVTPGTAPVRIEEADGATLDVLVLPATDAARVWVVDAAAGGRRLFVGSGEVTWDAVGRVSVRGSGDTPDVREYVDGAWLTPEWEHADGAGVAASVSVRRVRASTLPSGDYGSRDGRQAAPDDAVLDAHAAVYRVDIPAGLDADAVLRVRWAGDVAQLRVDGVTATDRFWDGSELVANLHDIGAAPHARVEVRILPLRRDTGVHLPVDAAARLAASADGLSELDDARIDQRALWREIR
jgi:hypothetical protein